MHVAAVRTRNSLTIEWWGNKFCDSGPADENLRCRWQGWNPPFSSGTIHEQQLGGTGNIVNGTEAASA